VRLTCGTQAHLQGLSKPQQFTNLKVLSTFFHTQVTQTVGRQKMRVLIACEESQAVTIAFRELGHEAYSCDLYPCSGGHPERHYQQDVIPLLSEKWDLIIAFPTCTYLTSAGTRHYSLKMNPEWKVKEREQKREEAAKFFMLFANADCPKIAIENPVGWMNTHYRKPDQIIHPYYFGDNAKKRTCLWLKGLPLLVPTNMLPEPEPMYICEGEKCKGKKIGWCEGMRNIKGGQEARAKARSKTFPGIAQAMAQQWGIPCLPTKHAPDRFQRMPASVIPLQSSFFADVPPATISGR